MLDTSLQPGLWKHRVHPWKQLQSWCPQPRAGSPVKGKGSSAKLLLAPQDCCQWRLARGRAAAASARASPLPFPSWLLRSWHGLTWLPAPGTGQWAGGLCCCDLAPSRLLLTRGRQPKEWSRSLKCNLWLLGAGCRSPRPDTGCLQASHSPSDAHEVHVPLLEAPAPKNLLSQLNQHF